MYHHILQTHFGLKGHLDRGGGGGGGGGGASIPALLPPHHAPPTFTPQLKNGLTRGAGRTLHTCPHRPITAILADILSRRLGLPCQRTRALLVRSNDKQDELAGLTASDAHLTACTHPLPLLPHCSTHTHSRVPRRHFAYRFSEGLWGAHLRRGTSAARACNTGVHLSGQDGTRDPAPERLLHSPFYHAGISPRTPLTCAPAALMRDATPLGSPSLPPRATGGTWTGHRAPTPHSTGGLCGAGDCRLAFFAHYLHASWAVRGTAGMGCILHYQFGPPQGWWLAGCGRYCREGRTSAHHPPPAWWRRSPPALAGSCGCAREEPALALAVPFLPLRLEHAGTGLPGGTLNTMATFIRRRGSP